METKKIFKENWKPVTIGGVTGIMIGSGATYAVQNHAGHDETLEVPVDQLAAATTNDDLSFSEAFKAARAEMGPGATFQWRGNIYSTYTAEEWQAQNGDAKPNEEPKVTEDPQVAEEPKAVEETEAVAVTSPSDNDVSIAEDQQAKIEATNHPVTSDDDDVRVVGFGEVTLPNGRNITVQEVDYNGQRVAIVDVDQDGTADFALSDVNHNRQMDEGEVIDLHTGEALSFTNDDDNQLAMNTADDMTI